MPPICSCGGVKCFLFPNEQIGAFAFLEALYRGREMGGVLFPFQTKLNVLYTSCKTGFGFCFGFVSWLKLGTNEEWKVLKNAFRASPQLS